MTHSYFARHLFKGVWGGERNRALVFNGYKVSVWKDETVQETDGGD